MTLPYELKLHTERIGDLALSIATLADLDRAVDELCAEYEQRHADDELERDLCPYFGVVWPAARGLCQVLARLRTELAGRSFLELGCGLALPSLLAARLGARVTASDLHPDVPVFLGRNLEINGLAPDAIAYRELDWRAPDEARTYDFVVGSDILYEAGHPGPVARALAAHVAPRGRIVLADPGRTHLQACLDGLTALGFRHEVAVESVADAQHDRAGDAATREVFVIVSRRDDA